MSTPENPDVFGPFEQKNGQWFPSTPEIPSEQDDTDPLPIVGEVPKGPVGEFFEARDGELQSLTPYVSAWEKADIATLDGDFTAKQLELIARWMRENSAPSKTLWQIEHENGQQTIWHERELRESIASHGMDNILSITRYRGNEQC